MKLTNLKSICEAAMPGPNGFTDTEAFEIFQDTFDQPLIQKLLAVVEAAELMASSPNALRIREALAALEE